MKKPRLLTLNFLYRPIVFAIGLTVILSGCAGISVWRTIPATDFPVNFGDMEEYVIEIKRRHRKATYGVHHDEYLISYSGPYGGFSSTMYRFIDGELDVGAISSEVASYYHFANIEKLYSDVCKTLKMSVKEKFGQISYKEGEACNNYCLTYSTKVGPYPVGGMHCTDHKYNKEFRDFVLKSVASFSIRRVDEDGAFSHFEGTKYVGELKKGKAHGQGTSTEPNGTKYVGEWKDGKRHGQGTLTFPDGTKYVGEWKDGKRHGQGTFTEVGGTKTKYVGEWKDGKRHGQGTLTLQYGDKYEGGFKDGKRHGGGIITFPDGREMEVNGSVNN